jgi:hypothetical protein
MHRATLTAGLLALCLTGCGPSAPSTYPVSGTVTFDGKPVSDGDILFVPLDRRLGPDAGKIVAGRYATRAKAGKCRVEITALDIGPHTKYVDNSPLAANYVPARYNDESELTAEVLAGGKNVFDFSLQSGRGPPPKSRL